MKKVFWRFSCILLVLVIGTIFCGFKSALAEEDSSEENDEAIKAATSISITPVSKVLKLEPSSVYEDSFTVSNNGGNVMEFEVYAAPYSYIFSEEDNEYRLGFNQETTYNQIVRWVTFQDASGNFVKNPTFRVDPGESTKVVYRITTPSSIPDGGQYAVLFAHTLSTTVLSNGIKTEASPGLVVYGRSSGETISEAEMSGLQINRSINDGENEKTMINASAKVKNVGNVDFMASGKLQVTGIFGESYYETPANQGIISVIPETELAVSDKWEGTPYFGLFKVTWTVSAAGIVETTDQMILIMPAPVIVFLILLLTIIVVWIILMVRKRKERRAKFMV